MVGQEEPTPCSCAPVFLVASPSHRPFHLSYSIILFQLARYSTECGSVCAFALVIGGVARLTLFAVLSTGVPNAADEDASRDASNALEVMAPISSHPKQAKGGSVQPLMNRLLTLKTIRPVITPPING